MMKSVNNGKYDERDERNERERFITANLPLVYAVAKRFLGRGTDYDELCQAGALGLIKAYDGYDKERQAPFPSYAFKFIEGEIRSVLRKNRSVHISRGMRAAAAETAKFIEEYETKNAKAPNISEISDALDIETTDICFAINALTSGVSLNSKQGEAVSASLKSGDNTEKSAVSHTLMKQILKTLEKEEANVILLRYEQDLTQLETAKKLNCSQSKISKLEKSALLKIRTAFRCN